MTCARRLIEYSRAPVCPLCRAPRRDAASEFVELAASGDAEGVRRALQISGVTGGVEEARGLVEAVRNGHLEVVMHMLVHGVDVDGSVACVGGRERAVDVAVRMNSIPMVHMLLEAGADVDAWRTNTN